MGMWIYLPPLSAQQNQPPEVMNLALPFALAMQVAGGLVSAAAAERLRSRAALIGAWSACIVVALMLVAGPPAWMFILCAGIFGFCWMFYVPFQICHLIEMDPSRRSLVYISTAQSLGAASGPVLASLAVAGADVRGAILVGVILFGLSLLMVLLEIGAKRLAWNAT
jgi:MFS family permease